MNELELTNLTKEISEKYFKRPFVHQVKINHRMKTTGGRYHLDDHHIEINAHFLESKYRQELIGIIKHELCHYHLHQLGLGYRHRDYDFKRLMKQVGASRYAPDIGLRQKRKINYLYYCPHCGQEYPRVRRLNLRKYGCGRCRHRLKLKEKYL